MAPRITPWLGVAIAAAATAALAAHRAPATVPTLPTQLSYPALPKRPRPRKHSGRVMRYLSAALFVALAGATLIYLYTGGSLPFWQVIAGQADVKPECLLVLNGDHDFWETFMLYAAAFIAAVGLLLGFGMEHDSNAATRWRAYAVVDLSQSGLLTEAEAAALVAPTVESTWRQRHLSLPPKFLIPSKMSATLPNGRRATLDFTGEAAALQVTDSAGVTRTADFR